MDPQTLITAFVSLFVVIDPIGLAPIFVAVTRGTAREVRRAIAVRACLISAAILVVFGVAGEAVLGFFGISMAAFRIAGGLLLFLTALDMLFERRAPRRQGQADHPGDDPSVFPLAIPLIAGPGAIATMILLTGEAADPWEALAIHLIMAAVIAGVLALFLAAAPIERVLGPMGISMVTRLLGMILAALSVQFVIDGVRDLQVIGAAPGPI